MCDDDFKVLNKSTMDLTYRNHAKHGTLNDVVIRDITTGPVHY